MPWSYGKAPYRNCLELKLLVKRMIKLGMLAVPKSIKEQRVNMIHLTPPVFKVSSQRSTLVFKVSKPFPYQSDYVVLWRYKTVVESNNGANHSPTKMKSTIHVRESSPIFQVSRQSLYHTDLALLLKHGAVVKFDAGTDLDPKVAESITNIVGIGGVTISGRCYTPEKLQRPTKIKLSKDPKEKS